jgi:hypothetical protein
LICVSVSPKLSVYFCFFDVGSLQASLKVFWFGRVNDKSRVMALTNVGKQKDGKIKTD